MVNNKSNITLPNGNVVGTWNGDNIKDLQKEIQRIQHEQKVNGDPRSNYVTKFGVPHQEQVPSHLRDFIAYIIWGTDKHGECLVASRANRIETVDYINEWCGNTIAQDAGARARDPNSGCK
jgi:hypothetical protein